MKTIEQKLGIYQSKESSWHMHTVQIPKPLWPVISGAAAEVVDIDRVVIEVSSTE